MERVGPQIKLEGRAGQLLSAGPPEEHVVLVSKFIKSSGCPCSKYLVSRLFYHPLPTLLPYFEGDWRNILSFTFTLIQSHQQNRWGSTANKNNSLALIFPPLSRRKYNSCGEKINFHYRTQALWQPPLLTSL